LHTETFIGIAASACTAASLLPQLTKVLKEKKAENVSLWMLLVLFVGLGLWVYYGILKTDLIIIISNSCSFIINVLLALFAIKYKNDHNP
jgi:MtN3 and saliva related transmembrane protein